MIQIQQGNILRGSFWPEKVRVISAKTIGERQVKIEAVGLETHRFYNPILSEEDIKNIEIIEEKPFKFSADGEALFLYLEDAITNRRTMEDILKDFERIPDEEAVNKVREASLEALATRHIDLIRILGEQQTAKENRLVPEYVEEFFKRAAVVLNIKMEKRQDGFWRISSIPFEIRNQGHPLLESVVNAILTRYAQSAGDGATFTDPDGRREGILWFLQAEIRDEKNEIAGKRLFAIYQDRSNALSFLNPAILWDLKPEASISGSDAPLDKDSVVSFVINQGLEKYKRELLERRERDAGIKKKYGIRSIESMILDSDGKISEYETRKMKSETIPEATIQNEMRRKEDLERKKARLEKEIEAEVHLYPTDPMILGAVRVVAGKAHADMVSDKEIEQIGMNIATEYERGQRRIPEDVSLQDLGYDIRSHGENAIRYIEVKARAKEGAVALTPNEWLMAQRLKEEYWLYVVTNAAFDPELYLIHNPAAKLEPDKEIDIVRYVVRNWKDKAEAVR